MSLPEMLKGYILANIRKEEDQRQVNDLWKKYMLAFKEIGDDEDVDFFKNWLRAHHAVTIRPGSKGAENKDYERIGSEFHRWVRDHREDLGLTESNAYVRFVKRDVDFFSRLTLKIRRAALEMKEGWESIYFNENRGFTLQTQTLLAAVAPDDSQEVIHRKVALVADFLDIWLARRVWNFRTISYSSVRYTLFTITKELRGRSLESLSEYLLSQLDDQPESFAREPNLRLHQQNYRQIRHILARLTHWVDSECGLVSHFEDMVVQGKARPFEIEHIWSDQYDKFADLYDHPADFEKDRNRLGGLLLLQRGLNQSLGDGSYEDKRDAYATKGENLLARSLHPTSYKNNPGFLSLIERTGLPFRSFETFGKHEQDERQELYIRIAEWVWNPSRVDITGMKPPVHEPIVDPEDVKSEVANTSARHEARLKFWQQLLPIAREKSDLHQNISPGRYHWLGARCHGQWWNYNVLAEETRIELYIDGPNASENKALFDALHAMRKEVEDEFGGELYWQRLNDKRASRISLTVPGGWADESTWPAAAKAATDAMTRLHAALGRRVDEIRRRGSD